mgnify:CR=1 FL=1
MAGQHLNQNSNHTRTNHAHRFIFANSQKPRTDNDIGTSIYSFPNKSSQILRTMLPISIKLDHVVISMIDGISSRGLETNCKTTVNWHINNIAADILADRKRAVMRSVINNYIIELRRDLPKLDYGVFYALFLVICRNGNKSSWTIRHAIPFSLFKISSIY